MKYGLNEEQWEAIIAPSPTVVSASAGSGKTRCLVAKILHTLDSGASPSSICAVTFTNKAANEMKSRLRQSHNIDGMQISTIHSMCVRIIREFPGHTPLKIPFTIYDEDDQISVVKTVLKARDFPDNPYDVLASISRAKSGQSTDKLEGNVLVIYNQYQDILKKNNACDFDDLLVYALSCLKHQDCQSKFISLWKHILVDEMQDTSQIQYDIILKLYDSNLTKTLFLVGDVSQSIYGWRGARPDNVRDFINKYNPTLRNLTYNYRSCSQIINHANQFLQFGEKMVPKSNNTGQVSLTVFNSYEDEAEKIAQALIKMRRFDETAILYRVNARSLEFEKAFSKHQIPYRVVGDLPFFRRRVVKDLLAMLRAASNPSDIESLARIINTPKRGFGETKKEKLLLEGRSYAEEVAKEIPAVDQFLRLLDSIKNDAPLAATQKLILETGYRQTLSKESDIFMVDAFVDVVSGYETVEDLILASSFLEKDSGKGVQLMTAHASKGLEFDRVFIVGVEEGVWPHKLSTDFSEEERLFYVACTRAKNYLNISYSKSRSYRGSILELFPSELFRRCYRGLFGKEMS